MVNSVITKESCIGKGGFWDEKTGVCYPGGVDYPKMPRSLDLRVKLTPQQREEIKQLHASGWSIRAISREYKDICSRRLIGFVLFPDRYKRALKISAASRIVTKEKHSEYMRKHRRRKRLIHTEAYDLWRKCSRAKLKKKE